LVTVNFALLFFWRIPSNPATVLLGVTPLFLIWSAIRLGPAITSTAIFTCALFVFLEAAEGRGPFRFFPAEKNLFYSQIYLIILSVPTLFLAISIAGREKIEARFSRIFRSNPEGIIISRLRDGCVIDNNERWEEIFGYRRREAINRPVDSLGIFATGADYSNLLQSVFAARGWYDFESSLRTRSGQRREALISAETDYIEGENCLVLIIRDITDRKQAVLQERTRIAQDIHDDLGARLTAISLLSDLSQSRRQSFKEICSGLRQISSQIQLCTQSIDEIVWAVSPQQDTVESFINYLQAYVSEALQPAGMRCRFQIPSPPPTRHLISEARHNLFMACREAINNIIKHSAATEVSLKVVYQDNLLVVTLTDNGVGFDPARAMLAANDPGMHGHHGLSNLRDRLESVGGELDLWSEPGKGTCMALSVDFRKLEARLVSRTVKPNGRNSDYSG
jgi:PAS domain S-box-containing protein